MPFGGSAAERKRKDAERKRLRRLDPEFRQYEQARNTAARRQSRQDIKIRQLEQERNTAARREARNNVNRRQLLHNHDTAAHLETCLSENCSLPSSEGSNLSMENSDKKFWKLQEDEMLSACCSGHEIQQFSESTIKAESVCPPDDDAANNVPNPDFVKTEEKLNYINWYQVIKDETVIEKEDDCVARDSELYPRLCEDFVKCSSNIIPTEIREVKNSLSLLDPDPTRDTNKLLCVDKNRTGVIKKNMGQYSPRSMFNRPYKCVDCGARFASKERLEVHIRIHVEENQYKCELCEVVCSSLRGLRRHENFHLSENMPAGESPFKCDACKAEFLLRSSLVSHKQNHDGKQLYKCDFCGLSFLFKNHLQTHRRIHTRNSYKCDFCGQEFSSKRYLDSHKRTHTGEKPYKCDVCGAEFRNNTGFYIHKQIHTREKTYKCDLCDAEFISNSSYIVHKIIHTGEKPYKCETCNTEFAEKGRLNQHKRKHTGETPYSKKFICDVCNAEFTNNDSLILHKATHIYKHSLEVRYL